jgi:hypothetical protein
MHLDVESARDHAVELAERRAAARAKAAAEARRPLELRGSHRTIPAQRSAPVMVVQHAGFKLRLAAGDRPTTARRPRDDWPVHTRLPRVTA